MTLRQWIERYQRLVHSHGELGTVWLPDFVETPTNPAERWSLFHLSDYVVSSVSGGSIWLVPAEDTMSADFGRIDPTTVGYLGDDSRGIYRYRVYFRVDEQPMTIDYFAFTAVHANEQFDADYPDHNRVIVDNVVNYTRKVKP